MIPYRYCWPMLKNWVKSNLVLFNKLYPPHILFKLQYIRHCPKNLGNEKVKQAYFPKDYNLLMEILIDFTIHHSVIDERYGNTGDKPVDNRDVQVQQLIPRLCPSTRFCWAGAPPCWSLCLPRTLFYELFFSLFIKDLAVDYF